MFCLRYEILIPENWKYKHLKDSLSPCVGHGFEPLLSGKLLVTVRDVFNSRTGHQPTILLSLPAERRPLAPGPSIDELLICRNSQCALLRFGLLCKELTGRCVYLTGRAVAQPG